MNTAKIIIATPAYGYSNVAFAVVLGKRLNSEDRCSCRRTELQKEHFLKCCLSRLGTRERDLIYLSTVDYAVLYPTKSRDQLRLAFLHVRWMHKYLCMNGVNNYLCVTLELPVIDWLCEFLSKMEKFEALR